MKADKDDAPPYLRQSGFKQSAKVWGAPILFGICIALGLLQVGSSLLLKLPPQNVDLSPIPEIVPISEISESAPAKDQDKWDRVVEEQLRRDNSEALAYTPKNLSHTNSPKQTVFNDKNYAPRGADNVVSFHTLPEQHTLSQPSQHSVRVTVVGETHSMKEKVCWPLKDGSLEKRNCKFGVGLNHRDRD